MIAENGKHADLTEACLLFASSNNLLRLLTTTGYGKKGSPPLLFRRPVWRRKHSARRWMQATNRMMKSCGAVPVFGPQEMTKAKTAGWQQ